MKIRSARIIDEKASRASAEVVIDLTPEQVSELRNALAVLESYKKTACHALELDLKLADWHMFEYEVKKDRVVITVARGMCG